MSEAEGKTDRLIRSTYQSIRSQTKQPYVQVADIRERTLLPVGILANWIRANATNGVRLLEIAERQCIEIL